MQFDPADQPKFDQLIADLIFFGGKYGEDFMLALFSRMMAQHSEKLASLSDQERSCIFVSGVQGLQRCAAEIHDQLFPFGHAGQSIEIED